MAETSGRRDGIRAGSVSGPWRGAGGISQERTSEAKPAAEPRSAAVHPDLGYDLPAPILSAPRDAETTRSRGEAPPVTPVLLEDDFSEFASARPFTKATQRRSPVLSAVLLGSVIALAIVALAFFLRPEPTGASDAVSPRAAPAAGSIRAA